MNYIKNYKIFESPDIIIYNNKLIMYSVGYTFGFGYIDDEFVIGNAGESHGDLYLSITGNIGTRDNYKYPGRVFLEQKIITFWVYPDKNQFDKIITELSYFFGTNLLDNDWKVEILDNGEEKFISISEYTGSSIRTEQELRKKHGEYQRPIDIGYKPKVKKIKDWMRNYESNDNNYRIK